MKRFVFVLCLLVIIQLYLVPAYKVVLSDELDTPKIKTSLQSLDFNHCSVNSRPIILFVISNLHKGVLKGEVISSSNWIRPSKTTFEGNLHLIEVALDVSNLQPKLYNETIKIKSNGGNVVLPLRLDLVAENVVIQMIYDNPTVFINGDSVLANAPPFVYHGFTYLPLRVIFESINADVSLEYKGEDRKKTVIVKYKDKNIEFYYDEKYMLLNNQIYQLTETIFIRFGITFIPLEALRKIINPVVHYNANERLITLII